MSGAATIWHLSRRFFGSLRPGPPDPDDERWAEAQLTAGEIGVWRRMSHPDRRHAVGVARCVAASLGDLAERPVLAAALLHDSGKVMSGLGTFARVGATVVWAVIDESRAHQWIAESSKVKRRLAQYRLHPQLGADWLSSVGSDPLTVTWTREHHLPGSHWTLPPEIADALKACDDD